MENRTRVSLLLLEARLDRSQPDSSIGAQVGDPAFPTWVLVEDGTIIGSTTVFAEPPAWCFTEHERSQPAVFPASTFTMPTAYKRLGRLIAS